MRRPAKLLWPDTVASRAILILVAALLAFHLLGYWAYRVSVENLATLGQDRGLAERIVSIKRVIAGLPEAPDRDRVAHDLSSASLEVHWSKVSLVLGSAPGTERTRTMEARLETLAPELATAEPGKLEAAALPTLRLVIRMGEETTPGMANFGDVLASGGLDEHERLDAISQELDPDEAINIQFTSGTTGAPKGATLSHHNIVNNGNFVTSAIRLTAEDRLCIPVPFYHCFGMSMGAVGCVSKGATMVFPGEGFDPGAVLKAVAGERCTGLYGVPTMFVAMLDHPDFTSFDLTSLRTGIMAGSPCPIEVMKKVVSLMHMSEVTIAYGMTETSPVSFQSNVDDPLEKRVSTVGRIQPHVEVKIVDTDGMTVAVGEAGELCTRGYSVMKGYWQDEEKTREAIDAEGWMHTGDLATLDAEGYCNIVGRVKDMVIRGGENVYPREVEEFLYRHPKIKEVQVFGVPDEKFGEALAAWIVLAPGQGATDEEIKAYCQGQIAHYKIPLYIRFKDSLPMTVTGKPQKFIMRDEMVAELGLKAAKTA